MAKKVERGAEESSGPAQEIPTGRFQRFMKLSSLSGQVTASVLGQKVKGIFQKEEDRLKSALETQVRNAERMVETMGHLKGAVMKVGQMISLHDGEGMPREISEILSKLQSQAPPLTYARIREQFMHSFSLPPEELFAEFSLEPLASASLGQVHRARTRGALDGDPRSPTREGVAVAVKIQYPGIADTISSDLKNLRAMLDTMGIVSRRFDSEGIFVEIRARLLEEVDYVQEAINLETFRDLFANDPRVVIPRYFPHLSSDRILTMELIEGMSTQEMLDAGLSQAQRNQIGYDILDIFLKQILHFDMVHADPHHGNYLFLPEGRIALLDFGCVKRLPPGFMNNYRALTRASMDNDTTAMVRALVELGFLKDDQDAKANALLCEISRLFLTPVIEDREYDYGTSELHLEAADIPKRFLALGKMAFPPDALYVNRVLFGLYFLLRKLGAKGNWHRLLMKHLDSAPQPSSAPPIQARIG